MPNEPMSLDIQTVLARYANELATMTRRALIAEATVEALQATRDAEEGLS